MILIEEINEKAKEFEIDVSNVQRDYVFGWVLFGLFTSSSLKDRVFLKGGNALRKAYFPETRFSNDIDLGIPDDIDQVVLRDELNKVCDFVSTQSGIVFDTERNLVEEKFPAGALAGELKVFEARIYFKGLAGEKDHIRIKIQMDITRFDKTLLDIQVRSLLHPYSDAKSLECNIRVMKLEEILATKLKCLLQREHAPDLFDYVYALFKSKGVALDKSEIISTFLKKTIFEPSPGVVKNIFLELPFDFFKKTWEKGIVCTKSIVFGAEEAIENFKKSIEEIFTPYPGDAGVYSGYFPARLRNPIIAAGRNQVMLKIKYDNHERLIEPYSLKYRKPSEASAKEYLYAFDTTGGKSGVQSIKSFLPEKIESIELTETKFTPRVDIELAKAGEMPENHLFYDPNKIHVTKARAFNPFSTRRNTMSRPQSVYSGPKYSYRCSMCGKKSVRRTSDGKSRSHKNDFGQDCYGYPIYEGMIY